MQGADVVGVGGQQFSRRRFRSGQIVVGALGLGEEVDDRRIRRWTTVRASAPLPALIKATAPRGTSDEFLVLSANARSSACAACGQRPARSEVSASRSCPR